MRVRAIARLFGANLAATFCGAILLSAPVGAQDANCPIPPEISGKYAAFLKQQMEKGDGSAGAILGALYSEGVSGSIPKDTAKSVACSRWAAERGDSLGQLHLGEDYLTGTGVPKDAAEGAEWVRKAADQDFQIAQFLMGRLYEQGNGVSVDKTEALKWYQLAAKPRKGGKPGSGNDANYAARQLETTMSPEDVATANERANAFVPTPAKKAVP